LRYGEILLYHPILHVGAIPTSSILLEVKVELVHILAHPVWNGLFTVWLLAPMAHVFACSTSVNEGLETRNELLSSHQASYGNT